MEYFDSDVIFNFLVVQDEYKHREARRLVFNAIEADIFTISTLVIQKVGFGLARFGISSREISTKLSFLNSLNIISIEQPDVARALIMAEKVGFKHINDCVHAAVAERLKPDKFYTYNKSDFTRIQKLTTTAITIL